MFIFHWNRFVEHPNRNYFHWILQRFRVFFFEWPTVSHRVKMKWCSHVAGVYNGTSENSYRNRSLIKMIVSHQLLPWPDLTISHYTIYNYKWMIEIVLFDSKKRIGYIRKWKLNWNNCCSCSMRKKKLYDDTIWKTIRWNLYSLYKSGSNKTSVQRHRDAAERSTIKFTKTKLNRSPISIRKIKAFDVLEDTQYLSLDRFEIDWFEITAIWYYPSLKCFCPNDKLKVLN